VQDSRYCWRAHAWLATSPGIVQGFGVGVGVGVGCGVGVCVGVGVKNGVGVIVCVGVGVGVSEGAGVGGVTRGSVKADGTGTEFNGLIGGVKIAKAMPSKHNPTQKASITVSGSIP
jgi:hypothetical protein